MELSTVAVTVALGDTTGTVAVPRGATILGIYPTANQDQFVDSVAISDVTLTVTLVAAATADNVFAVSILK